MGIEDEIPDHSTFSKNRHGRFRQSDTFRFVFEQVLRRCIDSGLVGGEGFAIDASVIKADANRTRGVSGVEFAYADHTQQTTRAVREYLDALDDTNETVSRKNISFTDPAASWTAGPGGPAFYAYSTNYLINVKAGIVMDVEATTANRAEEVEATRAMIDRVESRFGLKPKHLIGDTAYGTASLLGWLVHDEQIEPHMPCGTSPSDRTDRSAVPTHLRPTAGPISVSGRQISKHHRAVARRSMFPLPRQYLRLPSLRTEAEVLSAHAFAQSIAQRSRGRTRCRPRLGKDRSLSAITQGP